MYLCTYQVQVQVQVPSPSLSPTNSRDEKEIGPPIPKTPCRKQEKRAKEADQTIPKYRPARSLTDTFAMLFLTALFQMLVFPFFHSDAMLFDASSTNHSSLAMLHMLCMYQTPEGKLKLQRGKGEFAVLLCRNSMLTLK
ncbi:hypothetical protein DL95DRAFT_124965 [Leptodontidium sp. 2 PMI_412]|nr:hypothetical protein DL95DRAFT_124965 [Leptodontidium sp. 2 PMI_412]